MTNYVFNSNFEFGYAGDRLSRNDIANPTIIYPQGKLMFIEPYYTCRYAEFPGNYGDVPVFSYVVRPDEVFVVKSEYSYRTEVGTISTIYNGFFVSLKNADNNNSFPDCDICDKIYIREMFNPSLEEYSHVISTNVITYNKLASIDHVWKRMNLCNAVFDIEFPYMI